MLEEQLSSSRSRADKVLELESEIIKYKQLLNDMALVGILKCINYYCIYVQFNYNLKMDSHRNVQLIKKSIKSLSKKIPSYIKYPKLLLTKLLR